jgi:hypothetical protein
MPTDRFALRRIIAPSMAEVEWVRMRAEIDPIAGASGPPTRGLPARARKLVESLPVATVDELLALDPRRLLRRRNVGRGTLAAILQRIVDVTSLPTVMRRARLRVRLSSHPSEPGPNGCG